MPPFKPQQIDHIVLRIAEVARSLTFYCDILGLEKDRMRPKLGLYHLRAGDTMVDLVDIDGPLGREAGPAAGPPNMDHFCLLIEPFDEAAIRSHLESHGVTASEVESRYGALGQGPSLYLDDPDGNTVELKGRGEDG